MMIPVFVASTTTDSFQKEPRSMHQCVDHLPTPLSASTTPGLTPQKKAEQYYHENYLNIFFH